ncbi:hypothetical protein AMS68_004934 [Peltaster fructicola]|uniref:Acyltransferase MbtK/IucB-like conserved domain-containing protein n=1 Tax=Peltaster fructicola TaxID=286661 RepID=A0A6H0XXB5_9PEZI|nr:hypothetical protein AMS68_004934 [Peltaster fructicola]
MLELFIIEDDGSEDDHLRPDFEGPKIEHDLPTQKHSHIHRFKTPSLNNDHLFISSISNPSSSDFKPVTSPTRQIAMMLWATLWWYFHQPAPEPYVSTAASASTPDAGKPKGEWRIYINREGIFKGKHLLPKLERMGLITSEDSSVGIDPEAGAGRDTGIGFERCFVSRRSFWQLDARIYLFTMAPTASPFPIISPSNSRPSSPSRTPPLAMTPRNAEDMQWRSATPPGPFSSTSRLPTFYPPAPLQYTFTGNIRHPIRPKPSRQGEVVYTRFVPSLEQYISFRVATLSQRPVLHRGPTGASFAETQLAPGTRESLRAAFSDTSVPTVSADTLNMTDLQLLHKWMNDPRVSASWGEQGDISHQEAFLKHGLESRHSIPVIGCFDGKPFGYFEVYWVKEDKLASHLGGNCGDWDRGLHVLVGEQEFRGAHRVKVWLSALVHYCLLADMRTTAIYMEPRVDNQKVKQYCEEVGFHKEREVTFPHKQSNLMKITREAWDAPALQSPWQAYYNSNVNCHTCWERTMEERAHRVFVDDN